MEILKMNNKVYLLALFISLIAPSCKDKEPIDLCWKEDAGNGAGMFQPVPELDCVDGIQLSTIMMPAGGTIDLQLLMNAIADSFSQVPGYQIAVGYNNNVVAFKNSGYARTTDECWPLLMKSCNKNNIASVSKILTAAATFMLLEDNGLDENAMIKNWLPPSWNVNSTTDSLTFRALFNHRSGLLSTNTNFNSTLSYDGIKACLELGVQDTLVGIQNYLNVNYALMRVIIPRLWQVRSDCPMDIKNITEVDASIANTYYEKAIQQLILQPAGITDGALVNHSSNINKTLYYNVTSGGEGLDAGSWTAIAGGGGWYLSAKDLVLIMQRLFSNNYVSASTLNKMETMVMGFWNQPMAEDGRAYGHGGDIGDTAGNGFHSMLLHFPSGVSIAFNINSNLNYSSASTSRIITTAYDLARS